MIVVLGAALSRDGGLGPALAERVEAGVAAWKAGRAPLLLMTGALEASAMRARAVELGVPGEAILIEHSALTTRENALFCAEILRRRGLERALLVTQRYHRPRSVAAFRRAGVEAEALGFDGRSATARMLARECVALAVYGARGWLRHKI